MPAVLFQPDQERVEMAEGETLLAAALRAGIPIANACGGDARCSTCRVLVAEGAEHLSPMEEPERSLLEPLGLDRSIRLACQTVPLGPLEVYRLVLDPEDEALADQRRRDALASPVGDERTVAILFADIRNFTAFAEPLLPYDVVHVLNRFFAIAGEVVESRRGRIATYLGDGFMAIFGAGVRPEPPAAPPPVPFALVERLAQHIEAPLDAVRAGLELIDRVAAFQAYLKRLHGTGFGISIGIHLGPAVVGAIGSGESRVLTAIGDAVNTASRVEWANRAHGTSLLVSGAVREAVGDRFDMRELPSIELPGKSGRHTLWEARRKHG